MILALQFIPATFFANLRNNFRQQIQLPGTPVLLEGKLVYLDALVVENNTTIATASPDPKNTRGVPTIDNQNQKHPTANLDAVIQIDQPVTVHYYTFDQLDKAPSPGDNPGPTTNVTYDVNIELAVDISGAPPPAIALSLLSVTRQGKIIPDAQAEITPFFPPTSVALDFSSLKFLSDPNVANVGLSNFTRGGICVSATGVPALAFELENPSVGPSPSPLWDWNAFNMPGTSLDLLQGSDYGMVLDGRIVADLLAGIANSGLQEKVVQNQIQLDSSPSGFWVVDRAIATFSGKVVNACTFLFFTHDLGFDATLQLIPQVPQENKVRFDVTADFGTKLWDDFVCSFSAATFPLNVVNVLQQGKIDPGVAAAISLAHFFGGLEGFLNIFTGTLVLGPKQQDPLADYKKQNPTLQVPPSTTHSSEIYIDQDQKLPDLPVGKPFLESVAPHPIGPILQGKLFPPATDIPPSDPLSLYIVPFAWTNLATDCSLSPGVVGTVGANNANVISAQVVEDPLQQFSPFLTLYDSFVTVSIPQVFVPPACPYPCRILLFTDLGVRIMELGVFQQITSGDMARMEAVLATDGNCGGVGSSELAAGKWSIEWLGDPGPDPYETHLWTFGFSSLGADNNLNIQDSAGKSLAVAHTFGSQAQASVLTAFRNVAAHVQSLPPAAAQRESLTIYRQGSPLDLRPKQRIIRVTQTTLAPIAELLLDDVCLSLEIGAERGTPLALGVLPTGLNVWSLPSRKIPRLRFQLPRSGLAGALLIEGRYIIWGQDGIFSIPAPDPRWSSSLVRGPAANILGVIPAGLGFLALSPDKLFRLDPQLRPVSELPLTGAFDMAPAGQYAIIAARTGITQVDITAPQLSALHTITRSVTAIGRANVSGHTGAFYALDTDGTHSILEFTPGGQVETLNTYADEPWFAASRTLGSTLVRLSPLRGILFVHQVRKVLRFQT